MNKDLLDQLSADELAVAERLSSAAELIKLSQSFQSNLETKLMDAYPSRNKTQILLMKVLKPVGWILAAIAAVLVVGGMLGALLPGLQPATEPTPIQEISFEANVRQGNSCAAPLAVAHNFAVYLTSSDKTQFTAIEAGNPMDELRSFMWSTDGKQLAVLVNALGHGNLHLSAADGSSPQPVLSNSALGYLVNAAWSRDSRQFVTWSSQNNKVLYVINADGSGVVEIPLQGMILGAPQFSPDGRSIVFYGSDSTSIGLFEVRLNDTKATLINPSAENATSFAFSPDGSQLAYTQYDHGLGQVYVIIEELASGERSVLGSFSIPKGSGSSVPGTANMSWSVDGKFIVFDVGRGANDRVIYLAQVDGIELVKVVEAGYAPAISSDGKCLAFINNKQLWLLDLAAVSKSIAATPVWLADLPAGRGGPNYQLDKLQWRPAP